MQYTSENITTTDPKVCTSAQGDLAPAHLHQAQGAPEAGREHT
jgi:hypothetical protein